MGGLMQICSLKIEHQPRIRSIQLLVDWVFNLSFYNLGCVCYEGKQDFRKYFFIFCCLNFFYNLVNGKS